MSGVSFLSELAPEHEAAVRGAADAPAQPEEGPRRRQRGAESADGDEDVGARGCREALRQTAELQGPRRALDRAPPPRARDEVRQRERQRSLVVPRTTRQPSGTENDTAA